MPPLYLRTMVKHPILSYRLWRTFRTIRRDLAKMRHPAGTRRTP